MLNKKIVLVGCLEEGWDLFQSLSKNGVNFDHIVTVHPSDKEKHAISGYKDFSDIAEKYNIPIYHVRSYSLKDQADIDFFREHKFDLLIQGGWQRLFPEAVLDTLSIGAIGVHGSSDFLPKGRGRSPMNWSLIEDKKRFIMHLFLIKPGIDDGDVFDYEFFDINEFDTIKTLYYKKTILTKRMILRNIPKLLSGDIKTTPQEGIPSYYPKRTPDDGLIDWEEMDVRYIYNFVRAQTKPYPGAFGTIDGKKYKIWGSKVFDTRISYPDHKYGACVEKFENDMVINCRGGLLLVDDYELM